MERDSHPVVIYGASAPVGVGSGDDYGWNSGDEIGADEWDSDADYDDEEDREDFF